MISDLNCKIIIIIITIMITTIITNKLILKTTLPSDLHEMSVRLHFWNAAHSRCHTSRPPKNMTNFKNKRAVNRIREMVSFKLCKEIEKEVFHLVASEGSNLRPSDSTLRCSTTEPRSCIADDEETRKDINLAQSTCRNVCNVCFWYYPSKERYNQFVTKRDRKREKPRPSPQED